ncbi:MAG: hypothetical protein OEX08_02480 [Candidatus Nomurabacteria bacterium]|nr:hypothetical protein [Candidatus Nomurabacteria bacterium]
METKTIEMRITDPMDSSKKNNGLNKGGSSVTPKLNMSKWMEENFTPDSPVVKKLQNGMNEDSEGWCDSVDKKENHPHNLFIDDLIEVTRSRRKK